MIIYFEISLSFNREITPALSGGGLSGAYVGMMAKFIVGVYKNSLTKSIEKFAFQFANTKIDEINKALDAKKRNWLNFIQLELKELHSKIEEVFFYKKIRLSIK